jgi:hypothetical protein
MNRSYRFRISHLLYVLGFVFLIAAEGVGQSISWRVNPVIAFTISSGIVVGNQCQLVAPATNSASSFRYSAGNAIRKITVRTSCTSPRFTLQVSGTVTRGTAIAQGPVILNSGVATDFIRDIPRNSTNGRCTLNYTASATFANGTGTDTHTVTYTIATQ